MVGHQKSQEACEMPLVDEPKEQTQWSVHRDYLIANSWIIFIVAGHCLCAAVMTLANKWALNVYPHAFVLTLAQVFFAAFFILVLKWMRLVDCDDMEWSKMKAFLPAAGMFYVTLTAGNKVLQVASVDTFIVMRSCVPLLCSFLEMAAFDQPYPDTRCICALVLMIIGATTFALADGDTAIKGIDYIIIFAIAMPVDGVLIKKVVSDVSLKPWGLALYNNAGAVLFAPIGTILSGATSEMLTGSNYVDLFTRETRLAVSVSIFVGFLISFFQMNVRRAISATGFMVLGVVNKFLVVGFNRVIFTVAPNWIGGIGVLVTILSGVLWQMAMSMRTFTHSEKNQEAQASTDVEQQALVSSKVLRRKGFVQTCFDHPYAVLGSLAVMMILRESVRHVYYVA